MDIIGIVGSKPIHLTKGIKTLCQLDRPIVYRYRSKRWKEAKELIEIGDPVTYDNTIEPMMNDLYCARAFDNRAGACCGRSYEKCLQK
jgi:putative aminopeptidase FrvX